MKLTISVPDALWENALSASTVGDSPSAVVQAALRVATGGDAFGPMKDLDEEGKELFAKAAIQVRVSAEDEYSRGYKCGLRLAQELDWTTLHRYAQEGIAASYRSEVVRVATALAAGKYPADDKGAPKSPFVCDERNNEDGGLTHGEDDDGEWFSDSDPHNRWGRSLNIRQLPDGKPELVDKRNGYINPDPNTYPESFARDESLFVRGTDTALRDILTAATPR